MSSKNPTTGDTMADMFRRISDVIGAATSPIRVQEAQLRLKLRRAGVVPRRLDLQSGTLHAWTGGTGPALVMLQGFGADALWQWHNQIPALAPRFRLCAPDLLGFGGSVPRAAQLTVEGQVAVVLDMLDALGIERCDLVGVSYGGIVAWLLASRYPDRIRRLVLVGSPGPAVGRSDYEAMLTRFGVRHVAELMLPRDPEGVRRLIEIAWYRPPVIPAFALRDAHRRMFTSQVEHKRALLDDLVSRMDEPRDHLTVPQETLLVWGEHDRVFPVSLGLRLQRRMGANARLHVIADAAHAPNQERVRTFNRLLTDFLSPQPA